MSIIIKILWTQPLFQRIFTLGNLVLSLLVVNSVGSFSKSFVTSNTDINNLGTGNTKLDNLVEDSYFKLIVSKNDAFFSKLFQREFYKLFTIGDLAGILILGLHIAVRNVKNDRLGGLLFFNRLGGLGVRHFLYYMKIYKKKEKKNFVSFNFFLL